MTGTIARVGDPQGARAPDAAAGDLRSWLRMCSAAEHARLDASLGTLDVGDADGYRRFLMAHAIGLAAVQPAAEDFVRRVLGRTLPDAAAMLAADMAEVGMAMPAGAPAPIPTAQGAGAAYVLLGSRMGMAVITRGVALPAGTTGRYLFDRDLGAMWKPMRDWLGAAAACGPQAAAALAGTRAAFAAFTAGALAAHGGPRQ